MKKPQVYATEPRWWEENIGSGYDLVPSSDKAFPELMFTQFYIAMLGHN